MRYWAWVAIFFLTILQEAQSQVIEGIVVDSLTRQPLAFANFLLDDRKTGTTSDIDGRYRLTLSGSLVGRVTISYVGYQSRQIRVSLLIGLKHVALMPEERQLGEVVIYAGENPAWRIIRNAVKNRERHKPTQLRSYYYKSYTKVIFKLEGETPPSDSLSRKNANGQLSQADSLALQMDSLQRRQHLLVTESVAEKYYRKPGKQFEKLLDYRVSGFETPLLAALPNDYQPLGFADDWISILGKDHLNPISKNSEKIYDFEVVDTTYYQRDTVYTLAFLPLGKSSQSLLQGTVSICTRGWAIKSVIAKPIDPFAKVDFRIQQNYERVDTTWFPIQLNTDLHFRENKLGYLHLAATARSYLRDIAINPDLSTSVFQDVEVALDPRPDSSILADYRVGPLDEKEVRTFHWYDSINQRITVLKTLDRLSEGFFSNAFSTGKIDWQLNKVLRLNEYEQVRLGLGIRTNPRFSRWFSVGAYAGYGFRDQAWKYGGNLKFQLNHRRDLYLQASYFRDLREPGTHRFFEEYRTIGSFSFRELVASRFDQQTHVGLQLNWKPSPSWQLKWGVDHSRFQPLYDYTYVYAGESVSAFTISEFTSEINYIHRMRQVSVAGRKAMVQFELPVATLRVSRAVLGVWNSEFDYTRVEWFLADRWKSRRLGTSLVSVVGGALLGTAPLQKQFFAPGSRETGYWVNHSFQTMGIYEFLSDQYLAAFLKHNFGWLYQSRYSKPELIIAQSVGWGRFGNAANQNAHEGLEFKTLEKGFFETGMGFENIIRFNYVDVAFFGVGGAVYLRWGPYANPSIGQNVSYRFNMTFSF